MAHVIGAVYLTAGMCGWVSNPCIGAHGFIQTNSEHDLLNGIFGIVLLLCSLGGEIVSSLGLYFVAMLSAAVAGMGLLSLNAAGVGRISDVILVNSAGNWFHALIAVVCVIGAMSNTSSKQVMYE
jgi:ATP/ADP translocase